MSSLFEFSGLWDQLPSLATIAAFFSCALLGGAHCCGGKEGDCCHSGHEHDEEDSVYAKIESQIEELKSQYESGDKSVLRNLADVTLAFAVRLQQDDFLEESVSVYGDAIEHFQLLQKEHPQDTDITRLIGLSYLSRAVTFNDIDEKEFAVKDYDSALAVLAPLDAAGDGEAKYDIAGIKLNLGTIYHELGEWDKAAKLLDASFMEFRALEKISELDTRFYMGKVSVALGNLFRDQEEPIEKIVDVYDRAMRLFVELVDGGEVHHELDLANALIGRCMARFEAGQKEKDVLIDMQRGIEILEKQNNEGNEAAFYDLFMTLLLYSDVLADLEKHNDALNVLNEIAEKFKEVEEIDDPVLFNEYAGVFGRRSMCHFHLGKPEEAVKDLSKEIELKEKLWEDEWDLDDETLAHLAPSLVSAYCHRGVIYDALGKKDLAMDDCKKAANVLEPYEEDLGEDYQELLAQIDAIRDGK
ncbi:MAG: tetratricopeptide repeat protein [Planctomycetaceae bacterium]|nr:tetratricopeptide repeat protein [Planctomycetaceae bacterium]